MRVGFIGLGGMGLPMAMRLLQPDLRLQAYNRTANRAKALLERGATWAASPAEATQGADVVITMLADDAALEEVTFGSDGICNHLRRGGVHVSMGTVSVALARRLCAAHREAGQFHVGAPVFGRPQAAVEGRLSVVAAGPAAQLDACEPLFAGVGCHTYRVGHEAYAAHLIKLAGNYLLVGAVQALSEAVALTSKAGVPTAHVIDVLTGTLFGSAAHKTYGRLMADRHDNTKADDGLTLSLARRDLRLIMQAAQLFDAPLPGAPVLEDALALADRHAPQDADLMALWHLAQHRGNS